VRNKHVIFAVVATYLLISFVPSLSLTSLMGRGKKSGGS
jgi:hypothetical protein